MSYRVWVGLVHVDTWFLGFAKRSVVIEEFGLELSSARNMIEIVGTLESQVMGKAWISSFWVLGHICYDTNELNEFVRFEERNRLLGRDPSYSRFIRYPLYVDHLLVDMKCYIRWPWYSSITVHSAGETQTNMTDHWEKWKNLLETPIWCGRINIWMKQSQHWLRAPTL